MTKMPGSCPFNFHLMDSCLKFRKQSVRTNNTYSSFRCAAKYSYGRLTILHFCKLLVLVHKHASFHDYADGNTLSTYSSDLNSLLYVLIVEFQTTMNWLIENGKIVNPKKIQTVYHRQKTPYLRFLCSLCSF